MRIGAQLLAALVVSSMVAIEHSGAGTTDCPYRSNDACDQWQFEQSDKELASTVELALAQIDSFAHPSTRQEAKERLNQAHRLWGQTREVDCQAESALMWLRSARTREGYTAACMHALTVRRIVELKKRYLLRD